jgi:hypothetical protein
VIAWVFSLFVDGYGKFSQFVDNGRKSLVRHTKDLRLMNERVLLVTGH